MKKTTQKELRSLVARGIARELTESSRELYRKLHRVAVSTGMIGMTGLLLEDDAGNLYAVTDRTPELFFYGA